ncbi:MAG: Bcr/CflA family drug resistance efflux transporter, partial [Betaproteobacteria bacterium]
TGATIGSRLVRRWGIDTMIRRASVLLLAAGATAMLLAWGGATHPLAVVVPMFCYMVAMMTTMPPATAGALTPFPEIAGAAASLLSFVQFVMASTAALAVGLTFDGTSRAMATVTGVCALCAFVAGRVFIARPDAAAQR